MAGLLLVPYNDSMRLGQGYNSFLQTPCVHNAMFMGTDEDHDGILDIKVSGDGNSAPPSYSGGVPRRGVSQVVSYSSRFANKISEVVKSMNISAGTSIKNGGISVSGNSLNIDELKFTLSDLNVVVSVKVVNQQTELLDTAEFNPPKFQMNSEMFHEFYGDSYISGFIEGGDLHGIVSVKALDASKKDQIKTT
jgi:hypothetical protein